MHETRLYRPFRLTNIRNRTVLLSRPADRGFEHDGAEAGNRAGQYSFSSRGKDDENDSPEKRENQKSQRSCRVVADNNAAPRPPAFTYKPFVAIETGRKRSRMIASADKCY